MVIAHVATSDDFKAATIVFCWLWDRPCFGTECAVHFFARPMSRGQWVAWEYRHTVLGTWSMEEKRRNPWGHCFPNMSKKVLIIAVNAKQRCGGSPTGIISGPRCLGSKMVPLEKYSISYISQLITLIFEKKHVGPNWPLAVGTRQEHVLKCWRLPSLLTCYYENRCQGSPQCWKLRLECFLVGGWWHMFWLEECVNKHDWIERQSTVHIDCLNMQKGQPSLQNTGIELVYHPGQNISNL